MAIQIAFRRANRADTRQVVPLLHSAGPQAIDYGFSRGGTSALAFLAAAFAGGSGFFGHRSQEVALVDGSVAAVAACYQRAAYVRLAMQHSFVVWRWFPAMEFIACMRRSLALQAVMPPPQAGVLYFANFGVAEPLRGRGIGRAMLERHIVAAARSGNRRFALDVAVDNPRAAALYERCGLRTIRRNRFPGPQGRVPDTLRMELRL